MMETFKDIRKATDNLLKFSSKSNSPQHQSGTNDGRKFSNNPIKLHKLAAASATAATVISPTTTSFLPSSDSVSEVDPEEWMVFETPPEEPKFQRVAAAAVETDPVNYTSASSSINEINDTLMMNHPDQIVEDEDQISIYRDDTNSPTSFLPIDTIESNNSEDALKDKSLLSIANSISQCSLSEDVSVEESFPSQDTSVLHSHPKEECLLDKECDDNIHSEIEQTSSSTGFIIPKSLFRISLFLKQEKANILFRLFGTITLRTINHESICCLNTLLLILLFENKR
jgi:hypothetical protein